MTKIKVRVNSINILFFVDIKSRDLPSLSLIGFYLKKKGYNVIFAPLHEWEISRFADIIVMNKPSAFEELVNSWRNQGKTILVIDTEGRTHDGKDLKIVRKLNFLPDVYFYWNKREFNKYYKERKKFDCNGKVLGCARTDFCHPSFVKIYEKNKIIKSLGLKKNDFIITLATRTHDVLRGKTEFFNHYKKRKNNHKYFISGKYEFKNSEQLLKMTKQFLIQVNKKFPKCKVVLKPHPNENNRHWVDFLNKEKLTNVKIMIGKTINELLSISKIHISHNTCQSTIEGKLFNIPVIELQNKYTNLISAKTHNNIADYNISNLNVLFRILNRIYINKTFKKSQIFKKYFNKYFYKFDGKRSKNYSLEVHRFIQKNYLINRKPSLKNIISNFCKNITIELFKIKYSFNLFKIINQGYDKRGRYRHRINNYDHLFWYKKYKRFNF